MSKKKKRKESPFAKKLTKVSHYSIDKRGFYLLHILPLLCFAFLVLSIFILSFVLHSKTYPIISQKMVKAGGVLVCLLIVALDVAAGILGFQAEVAQNKVKHLRLWLFECRDPSHDAFKLGLAAAALLALAHVIATLLGGCMCICSQDELSKASPNRQLSLACLVFSWIILAVGMSMLVIGTLSNNKSRASCGLTHHHFLSIGGILCFVHGLFCVAYYVSASAASHEEGKYGA